MAAKREDCELGHIPTPIVVQGLLMSQVIAMVAAASCSVWQILGPQQCTSCHRMEEASLAGIEGGGQGKGLCGH